MCEREREREERKGGRQKNYKNDDGHEELEAVVLCSRHANGKK